MVCPTRVWAWAQQLMAAIALGVLLLFSTLAFAATEQWALSIFQIGVFALGIWCSIRRRLRFPSIAILLAGVVAWAGIQCLAGWTVHRFATVNALVNWAAYFTLFVAAGQILETPETRRRFLRAALYAGFAICVLSTAQYFTSGGAIYWIFPVRAGRPFGPFVDPDHYAVFVELILPLGIYEALRDRGKVWLHIAMVGVFYASVIASASRAGAALATVEMLALPLIAGRPRIAGRTIAVSVLFAGLAATAVGWDVLWKRFHDRDPFRYRREIAVSTLRMARQRPWTGFGLGSYADVYPEFASFDTGLVVDHAHDDWAEWAAEGGIPMLLLMLGVAATGLRPAIRSVWGLGIYAVFLHALVDFPMRIPALAALEFTFLAALSAIRFTRERHPGITPSTGQ
jgi:O-antigen ligase